MQTNTTDQQLEILIKRLVTASAADESTIDEVAASPKVWWEVQRQIRNGPAASLSAFENIKRWLLIVIPVATAAVLLIAVIISSTISPTPDRAAVAPIDEPQDQIVEDPGDDVSPPIAVGGTKSFRERATRPGLLKTRNAAKNKSVVRPTIRTRGKDEIRSEFIALSYARDPESGQIVRVRVPRSMMVTVGLVASVDKPTALVDAEVLLGDDGLTRAIRFIR